MGFSVSDLACRRGDVTILSGVSFEVAAGEALILRGPNGAGKTTLLRCLAGLTPPVAGEIGLGPDDVAYSAHANGLKAQLTVAENLTFWADIYGAADIDAAVEAFSLSALMGRRAMHLSAGQSRRVSLARLVLTGRRLWALDEPTVSLDAEAVGWFAQAVTAHLEGGGAAIIATHIDLGLPAARVLELSQFRHDPETASGAFDEAFL